MIIKPFDLLNRDRYDVTIEGPRSKHD